MQAILDYMTECLFEPGIKWNKRYFDERSYSRWAAGEILERITSRPLIPAIDVVEEFMITMACFARFAEDPKQRFIFSVAEETAGGILLLLV